MNYLDDNGQFDKVLFWKLGIPSVWIFIIAVLFSNSCYIILEFKLG